MSSTPEIIDREQARELWRPYGERVDPDNSFDPQNPLHFWALAMTDKASAKAIHSSLPGEQDHPYWVGRQHEHYRQSVSDAVDSGIDGPLVEAFTRRNHELGAIASRHRGSQLGEMSFERLLVTVFRSGGINFLSAEQANTVSGRIFGSNGVPYFQFTPLSPMEWFHLNERSIRPGEPMPPLFGTDVKRGYVFAVATEATEPGSSFFGAMVHEHMHAYFGGLVLWSVQKEDGSLGVDYSHAGLLERSRGAPLLQTAIPPERARNFRSNEAITDLIAHEVAQNGLGTCGGCYPSEWQAVLRGLGRGQYSDGGQVLLRAMVSAALIEACDHTGLERKIVALEHIDSIMGSTKDMPDTPDGLFE